MGRGLEETFLQRRDTDGQQTYEKMLNITKHHENANQNHTEIQPHTSQNGYYQKSTNHMCWHGCGEREYSCTAGGNASLYSHCGKQ